MLSSLTRFLDTFKEYRIPAFSLNDLPGFPYEEFNRRQSVYTECELWYRGDALDETVVTTTGASVDKYPVKINPIPRSVVKHVATLFGEWVQDDRPLVYPRILTTETSGSAAAHKAEQVLYQAWWENNGRSIQLENGAIGQVYGGSIFRAAYYPMDPLRSVPIRIESIHPRWFVGRPSATDMFRLREAWIVKPVMPDEALEMGVPLESEDLAWMVEHYTDKNYEATINGRPVQFRVDGQLIEQDGVNPFGFVPVVYIPHWRAGGFYGENLFDQLKGVIKEMNARVADYGDAVSVDSHAYLGMRNVNGAPQVMQIAPGLFTINLGTNPNITGQENNPDLFSVNKPMASTSMKDLVEELENIYRRDAFVPAIADGEDEGSQRSGLTLAMRMWPLVSHTNLERVFWTVGLDLLNKMILKMLQIKGESGITEQMTQMRIKEEWAPALPRDREAQVQEAVSRIGSQLGSPEHLLEMLGDVDNPEAEVKRILAFSKALAEIQAAANPWQQQAGGGKPGAGANGSAKPDTKQPTQTGKMQTSE